MSLSLHCLRATETTKAWPWGEQEKETQGITSDARQSLWGLFSPGRALQSLTHLILITPLGGSITNRWGNWGSERLSTLGRVTQLLRGRIWVQAGGFLDGSDAKESACNAGHDWMTNTVSGSRVQNQSLCSCEFPRSQIQSSSLSLPSPAQGLPIGGAGSIFVNGGLLTR